VENCGPSIWRYVPFAAEGAPPAAAAATSAARVRGQKGSAKETCAAIPAPKNDVDRRSERSTTWSRTTIDRGGSSSRRLPTALTPITVSQPSDFSAQTFAR
jgi:hypothetical protein